MKRLAIFMKSHSRWLLLVFFFLFVVFGIYFFEIISPDELAQQKRVGEAILPFALSLGALLSSAAGLVYLDGWLGKQKTQNQININWIKRFPSIKLNKGFKIIQSDQYPGVLYIWDLKNKTRHWIVSPKTLRSLALSYADVQTVKDGEFRKIKRGDNINLDT